MSIFTFLVAIAAAVVLSAGWQHLRYLRWRRTRALDHQPLLHARSAFHVISYLGMCGRNIQ